MVMVTFISSFYSKDCFDRGVILIIPGFVFMNVLIV